jgi:hypothetical protein
MKPCIVCTTPTKSHHVATRDGCEQYCCHSCWQLRNTDDVQEALAEYSILTTEVLDELRAEFRTLPAAPDLETSLPALPVGDLDVREGAAGDVFELAGAEQAGEDIDFHGRFAGVIPRVDLPTDPQDPVYAAFGYTTAGGAREESYLAWLCIGDDGDDLADAVESLAAAMRGSPDV